MAISVQSFNQSLIQSLAGESIRLSGFGILKDTVSIAPATSLTLDAPQDSRCLMTC